VQWVAHLIQQPHGFKELVQTQCIHPFVAFFLKSLQISELLMA
jgi:hypothetical protein